MADIFKSKKSGAARQSNLDVFKKSAGNDTLMAGAAEEVKQQEPIVFRGAAAENQALYGAGFDQNAGPGDAAAYQGAAQQEQE